MAAFSFYAGTQQDQTKALHFGTMLDCQGRRVSNAVAAVSRVPWEFHDTGGVTHYFTGASTSLPAPHDVERVMNNDGLFLVFNATPSETSYVQVWGFRTQAELSSGTLSLLGEIAAPSVAGGASMITLHPRRI
ncbi:MAG TPA: hypothetical protein VM261_07095 [Kofleriaceae bacterium]|nr:hypothetical protein [Kofleriaceae bacterium]